MADKKKYFLLFLKWIVIISSVSFIAFRIVDSGHVLAENNFFSFSLKSVSLFLLAFLLVFVNWLVEAFKWKQLLKPYIIIDSITAYKGVLVGLSTAIFTPNRVGEYFGRSLVLKRDNYSVGLIATVTGSIAQILTTVVFGLIAFVFLFSYFPEMPFRYQNTMVLTLISSIIFMVLLLLLYFKIHKFIRFLFGLPFFKKIKQFEPELKAYSKEILAKTLFMSFFRYFVFVSQYLLLLEVFMVEILWYDAIIAISAGYFVMLIIPVFTFAEAGLRGAVALFFMEMVSNSTLGILSSAICLWIINLAIPALFGTYIISKIKVKND
ncbi:MAG: flippase-like domain-containing protein [Bacteroidales bacterium]|nr:flippase-like domain-containing protein [Bacteroidales bacterium]